MCATTAGIWLGKPLGLLHCCAGALNGCESSTLILFSMETLCSHSCAQPCLTSLMQVLSEKIGLAPYCEAAMFHKASGTLLVTDAVIFIPDSPPEVSTQDTAGCCCPEAARPP